MDPHFVRARTVSMGIGSCVWSALDPFVRVQAQASEEARRTFEYVELSSERQRRRLGPQ